MAWQGPTGVPSWGAGTAALALTRGAGRSGPSVAVASGQDTSRPDPARCSGSQANFALPVAVKRAHLENKA